MSAAPESNQPVPEGFYRSRSGRLLPIVEEVSAGGLAVKLVTHEMNFAKNVGTKVIFMDKGVVVEENTPKDFFESPKEDRARRFMSSIKWSG